MNKEKYKILLISSNRKNWFVDVSVMQEAEEIDPKISADSLRVSPIENLIFLRFEINNTGLSINSRKPGIFLYHRTA